MLVLSIYSVVTKWIFGMVCGKWHEAMAGIVLSSGTAWLTWTIWRRWLRVGIQGLCALIWHTDALLVFAIWLRCGSMQAVNIRDITIYTICDIGHHHLYLKVTRFLVLFSKSVIKTSLCCCFSGGSWYELSTEDCKDSTNVTIYIETI